MRLSRAVIALVVASSGCSFGGSAPNGDDAGGRGGPDAPPGTLDARRADAPPGTPDAPPPPDAMPAFSVDLCPAEYTGVIAAEPGSRYRYIPTAAAFAVQNADCNDDHLGWTHLIAFDDMVEAAAVGQYNTTGYSYVGAVQAPSQTNLTAAWFIFTGGPVTTGWSPSGPQPDDGDGVEDGAESLTVVASTGNMHDVTGLNAYEAVCECDGHPIDPTVATFLP